jgi:hypothetical protein
MPPVESLQVGGVPLLLTPPVVLIASLGLRGPVGGVDEEVVVAIPGKAICHTRRTRRY